ncbi:PP2C family protein-serine/threonine phosphatase [Microlunatus flavus]|uniref:Protein phosphatase n=1 Tax=Microlunatus flavus TaxID=1036181 RepID=A0A1H9B524_9ACTN|nr:protein phosphatase 2C domain-containing protein [Microlunatus flavus]SEP84034.1 protein phosphatase [Microlunatus flavus]
MALVLRVVSHSEIGLVRKNNQDSGFASPHLLVVADGMGGAAAGDLASAVAVDTLMRVDATTQGAAMLEVMSNAVEDANDRIADLVADDVSLDGMGTTVTAAMFDGRELGLVHIGDSRAYLLREGSLRRLTHDHSWVQSLVDEGRISQAEAAVHPHRSPLLRVLNGQPGADAELSILDLVAGDRLMFCSDGLCGLVDDPEIAELLALPDRDEALTALVDAARAEGGVDNITVLVADVVETATGLVGAPADLADTPAHADASTVLGAAAERPVPPARDAGAPDDTAVTRTGAAAGVPAGAPDDAAEEADDADPAAATDLTRAAAPAPASSAAADGAPRPGPVDEARYDPVPPAGRRWVRPVVAAVLVLAVVAAGLGAAYAWTRSQYYVGASGSQVAIYRGVSEGLPGLPLSELFEVQDLEVSSLPVYYQERVRSAIDVPSLAAARETVTELRDAATRCGPTGSPSPSPSPTASSPRASSSAGGRPSPSRGAVSTAPGASASSSAGPTC